MTTTNTIPSSAILNTEATERKPGIASAEKLFELADKWQKRIDELDADKGASDYSKGLAIGMRMAYYDCADRAAFDEKLEIERIMLNAL